MRTGAQTHTQTHTHTHTEEKRLKHCDLTVESHTTTDVRKTQQEE